MAEGQADRRVMWTLAVQIDPAARETIEQYIAALERIPGRIVTGIGTGGAAGGAPGGGGGYATTPQQAYTGPAQGPAVAAQGGGGPWAGTRPSSSSAPGSTLPDNPRIGVSDTPHASGAGRVERLPGGGRPVWVAIDSRGRPLGTAFSQREAESMAGVGPQTVTVPSQVGGLAGGSVPPRVLDIPGAGGGNEFNTGVYRPAWMSHQRRMESGNRSALAGAQKFPQKYQGGTPEEREIARTQELEDRGLIDTGEASRRYSAIRESQQRREGVVASRGIAKSYARDDAAIDADYEREMRRRATPSLAAATKLRARESEAHVAATERFTERFDKQVDTLNTKEAKDAEKREKDAGRTGGQSPARARELAAAWLENQQARSEAADARYAKMSGGRGSREQDPAKIQEQIRQANLRVEIEQAQIQRSLSYTGMAALEAARGFAYLGASGSESGVKILQSLAKIEGAFYMLRGVTLGISSIQRVGIGMQREAYQVSRARALFQQGGGTLTTAQASEQAAIEAANKFPEPAGFGMASMAFKGLMNPAIGIPVGAAAMALGVGAAGLHAYGEYNHEGPQIGGTSRPNSYTGQAGAGLGGMIYGRFPGGAGPFADPYSGMVESSYGVERAEKRTRQFGGAYDLGMAWYNYLGQKGQTELQQESIGRAASQRGLETQAIAGGYIPGFRSQFAEASGIMSQQESRRGVAEFGAQYGAMPYEREAAEREAEQAGEQAGYAGRIREKSAAQLQADVDLRTQQREQKDRELTEAQGKQQSDVARIADARKKRGTTWRNFPVSADAAISRLTGTASGWNTPTGIYTEDDVRNLVQTRAAKAELEDESGWFQNRVWGHRAQAIESRRNEMASRGAGQEVTYKKQENAQLRTDEERVRDLTKERVDLVEQEKQSRRAQAEEAKQAAIAELQAARQNLEIWTRIAETRRKGAEDTQARYGMMDPGQRAKLQVGRAMLRSGAPAWLVGKIAGGAGNFDEQDQELLRKRAIEDARGAGAGQAGSGGNGEPTYSGMTREEVERRVRMGAFTPGQGQRYLSSPDEQGSGEEGGMPGYGAREQARATEAETSRQQAVGRRDIAAGEAREFEGVATPEEQARRAAAGGPPITTPDQIAQQGTAAVNAALIEHDKAVIAILTRILTDNRVEFEKNIQAMQQQIRSGKAVVPAGGVSMDAKAFATQSQFA